MQAVVKFFWGQECLMGLSLGSAGGSSGPSMPVLEPQSVLQSLGGLILGSPGSLLECWWWQQWARCHGMLLGPWTVEMVWVKTGAVVVQISGSQVIRPGVDGGCDGLAEPISQPAGGMW